MGRPHTEGGSGVEEHEKKTAIPTTNIECQNTKKKQKWFLTLHKVQNADSILYSVCAFLTLSTSLKIYELCVYVFLSRLQLLIILFT